MIKSAISYKQNIFDIFSTRKICFEINIQKYYVNKASYHKNSKPEKHSLNVNSMELLRQIGERTADVFKTLRNM